MLKNKSGIFRAGQFFFYLFFAFLPFQIDALVLSAEIFFSGFFNPYLTHFIYLSDVFLILSLSLFAFSSMLRDGFWKKFSFGNKKFHLFVLSLLGAMFLGTWVGADFLNSLLYFLRFLEFYLVFLLLSNKVVDIKKLLTMVVFMMTFLAAIGIFQFLLQESLGLRFFGEPLVSSRELGVAKIDVLGESYLRAYSVFSHPNLFAGYLVFSLIFSFYLFRFMPRAMAFCLLVSLLALVLTFSRSAFLALFVAALFYFSFYGSKQLLKVILLTFLLVLLALLFLNVETLLVERFFFLSSDALSERLKYVDIALNMIGENIWGVGFGNFTLVMQQYYLFKLDPWLFQPVHNIYLLAFAELGILGGIILLFLFLYSALLLLRKVKIVKRERDFVAMVFSLLIAVLIIGFFDHYLLTLYQGQALMWFCLGLIFLIVSQEKKFL